MGNTHYTPGDWNAICDVCGFKYKASELRLRWDGAMVCRKDWEVRPPQDFVRGIKEQAGVPYSRPEAADRATTGYKQALAGATAVAHTDMGLDNRVIVDVVEQVYGVYTQGAATITIGATVVSGDTVIVRGMTTKGVAVTIIDNGTGTLEQIA